MSGLHIIVRWHEHKYINYPIQQRSPVEPNNPPDGAGAPPPPLLPNPNPDKPLEPKAGGLVNAGVGATGGVDGAAPPPKEKAVGAAVVGAAAAAGVVVPNTWVVLLPHVTIVN